MPPSLVNSIWGQMEYTPPRGPCNHKTSLMSPACACLRFMLHPLKSATTFDCDGCGHHASFHSMENKADEAIIQRWKTEEADRERETQSSSLNPRKRARKAIEAAPPVEDFQGNQRTRTGTASTRKRKTQGGSSATASRATFTDAMLNAFEADDHFVELVD
ncbi:hypothetical protein K402DRAFT_343312 [Aulographum hederae CBS 113979]|uniref:Uncharacterized protein n=1 Tax=Aulographum hederae CBS 113979 TaxID=1176131 RepID=A0A6G1GJS3_9PEZI|nr:hypothetical protein K402DRAFT_343312 [Aulographum hederae CBS 113979]